MTLENEPATERLVLALASFGANGVFIKRSKVA